MLTQRRLEVLPDVATYDFDVVWYIEYFLGAHFLPVPEGFLEGK